MPSSDAPNTLSGALQVGKLCKTQAAVRALQYVAFAFRPLHIDELLEALATAHASIFESKNSNGDRKTVYGKEDLTELMSEVLEVRDNGLVFFTDNDLRHRILTEIEPTDARTWPNGHDVLATICLQHLQCLGHETILKPWASTSRWLVDRRGECRLHSYVTAFWHEHSRLAEDQSRYLPALLHRTISSAIAMHKLKSKEHILSLRDKVNSGLWFSAAYGLRTLCKAYLEMGADLNLAKNWHNYPLQILNPPFRQRHLRLSPRFGNELEIAEDRLQAPDQYAHFVARNIQMNDLIELQKAFDTCHGMDGGVNSGFCHPGFSPLQMATLYGHSALLELFQEHTNFALSGRTNGGRHHALESSQCEIHRKTSAVISVNSLAREFGEKPERKRNVHADCVTDVRRSFRSLSLAETKVRNNFDPSTEENATVVADCASLHANSTPPEDQEWFFVTKEDVAMSEYEG